MCKLKYDETINLKDNAMLKVRPELWCEWDFEKNNELGLDVYEVTKGSNKKVWWICQKCNSNYDMSIYLRVGKQRSNCPYCSGKKVNHTNSLAALSPEIVDQWHPTLNGELTPHDFTCGSKKGVWWICYNCNSSYISQIQSKNRGDGCSYCAGKKVNQTNSLASLRPDLAKCWHKTLNNKTPHEVTYGSNKKAWWYCEKCENSYDMVIRDKNNGIGCPYCSGRRTDKKSSLGIKNAKLVSQIHPTKNDNLDTYGLACNSHKKVWWLGECGHEWEARIKTRNNGTGCPYCAKRKILVGYNDIWTTAPELASKLLNHEDGYKYMEFSSHRVDWKCLECNGIIEDKKIADINVYGLSCPNCSDGKSFAEKFMANLLSALNVDFENDTPFIWSEGKRYDFHIPSLNMIIETHGSQHYNGRFITLGGKTLKEEQINDKFKRELAVINGVNYYIEINCSENNLDYIRNSINCSEITKHFNLSDVNWEDIFKKSQKSISLEALSMWNKGFTNVDEIAKVLKVSHVTIRRYIKDWSKLGKCSMDDYYKRSKKKIVQLTLENQFVKNWESISDANREFSFNKTGSAISLNLSGENKSAYGFKWMYKEEYDNLIN